MPLEVPKSPTIRTTVYDNLKGVDFTNDSTNIWHRRSPDAVNMLPDESGRPFKRTGWEVAVTTGELVEKLQTAEEIEILKCHYFELAGADHVIIFTTGGVFAYRQEIVEQDGEKSTADICELLAPPKYAGDSRDEDCYLGYERAFFFEGNGRAAFYIYGNHKVWVYGYEDGEFTFGFAEDGFGAGQITIPTLLITADPSSCTGVTYESYNLLGNRACVEYQSNDMLYAYTVSNDEYTVNIDRATFNAKLSVTTNQNTAYNFTYTTQWDLTGGASASNVTLSKYGITISGTPTSGDTVVVEYIAGLLLPNNVSQQQLDLVEVYGTKVTQYDYPFEVISTGTPAEGQCLLVTDNTSTPSSGRRAWLRFNPNDLKTTESQEDIFRAVFPIKKVDITNYPDDLPEEEKDEVEKTGAAVINR